MLAHSDVAAYLLDRGLVSAASIVDGDLAIRDASSRNRNFRVERSGGPSYLVKQGLGPEGAATIAHEASVYRLLWSTGGCLVRSIPRFFAHDIEQSILLIELVAGGEDLRRHHLRQGCISLRLAAAIGRSLGCLHRTTRRVEADLPTTGQTPWILSIHRPDVSILREASGASLELIKTIQGTDGFATSLDDLRLRWRNEALIHFDVKWDNFVAFGGGRSGRPTRVKVVDWESARYGDPCWDIGSVFSHFLSLWLFSIPVTGHAPIERFPELARFPLGAMQPAIRRCWQTYVAEVGLSQGESSWWLRRSVELGAARLAQTAFEAAQMSTALTSNLALHLQLGLNILQRPREAAVQLLGLPFPGEPAA